MAHGHAPKELPASDRRRLEAYAWPWYRTCFLAGVVGLIVAILAAWIGDERSVQRFAYAYLVSFAFVLSLSLGGLFFVLIQHVAKAGWSVVVRRPAEVLAANMPVIAVLSAPIVLFAILGHVTDEPVLYPWSPQSMHAEHHAGADADHGDAHASAPIHTVANQEGQGPDTEPAQAHPAEAHGEHASEHGMPGLEYAVHVKGPWLTWWFFTLRWAVYLACWCGMGLYVWRLSTRQDQTGDVSLTERLEKRAGLLLVLFGLTVTGGAFDLLMSLDPRWYSTIYGVYYFAGSFLGTVAAMILAIMGLQRLGFMQSVNQEHFHDLGKWLFAFTFFWGYIAFSQYMLIWYASLPAETFWFEIRGMTTYVDETGVAHYAGRDWPYVALLLLFGHLLIPFAALLSRHGKRHRGWLAFWAGWLLVMHWIDLWWLVMPQFDEINATFGLVELGCLVGVLGIFLGGAVRVASQHALVPQKDPRLSESLAFENI